MIALSIFIQYSKYSDNGIRREGTSLITKTSFLKISQKRLHHFLLNFKYRFYILVAFDPINAILIEILGVGVYTERKTYFPQ